MNDLQMARGHVEGGFNLAVGEPVLLQQHLPFQHLVGGLEQYPSMDGHPALVDQLKALHPGHEVVITNGAKQALLAAFYAMEIYKPGSPIYHPGPYWPSYPTLAMLSGRNFTSWEKDESPVVCVTSPNNPDGSISAEPCDVWDAVYAHEMYGWTGLEPMRYKIRVGSAAKLLGLSGARVGWLLTKDQRLAREARRYVEITTSGVSMYSQRMVADALLFLSVSKNFADTAFRSVSDDLCRNGESFERILGDVCKEWVGTPMNGAGMFAWAKLKDPFRFHDATAQAKVAVVTGEVCGASRSYVRLNMAQDTAYAKEAFTAIRTAYDRSR